MHFTLRVFGIEWLDILLGRTVYDEPGFEHVSNTASETEIDRDLLCGCSECDGESEADGFRHKPRFGFS